jgi:hypothetical protein
LEQRKLGRRFLRCHVGRTPRVDGGRRRHSGRGYSGSRLVEIRETIEARVTETVQWSVVRCASRAATTGTRF